MNKLAALLLAGFLPGLATALTFRIESATVEPGTEIALRIFVDDADLAGHLLLDLSYPAGALEVVEAIPGDLAAAQPPAAPEQQATFLTHAWRDSRRSRDVLRFGWLYGQGYSGTGIVVALRFQINPNTTADIPLELVLVDAVQATPTLDTLAGNAVGGRLHVVLAANGGHIVRIVAPGAGSFVPAGSSVAMQAAVTDSDKRGPWVVHFYGDGILLGSVATPPYEMAWEDVQAGMHAVGALAEDNAGTTIAEASDVLFTALAPGSVHTQEWEQADANWYSLTPSPRRGQTPLAWQAAGGHFDDGGHATIDLDSLAPIVDHLYLAAVASGQTASFAHFADAELRIALNDLDSAQVASDAARFFVGEMAGDGTARIYVHRQPLTVETFGQWLVSQTILSPDPAAWERFGSLDRSLAKLLDAPPIWGLALLSPDIRPAGRLGIDSLQAAFQPEATCFLDLHAGWNLRSVPVTPRQAFGDLFPAVQRNDSQPVVAWEWLPDRGIYRLVPASGYLRPDCGYWLHSPAPAISTALRGPAGRETAQDGHGWHLWGPPVETPVPAATAPPPIVWSWLPERLFRVDAAPEDRPIWQAANRLMQGRAYWQRRQPAASSGR